MGIDYAVHLSLKLKQILAAAEKRGTRIEDAFASWDADSGGGLSISELEKGLRDLGIFDTMATRDVTSLFGSF